MPVRPLSCADADLGEQAVLGAALVGLVQSPVPCERRARRDHKGGGPVRAQPGVLHLRARDAVARRAQAVLLPGAASGHRGVDAAGVNCVTLANNHALDFGPIALLDTLSMWRPPGSRGSAPAGTLTGPGPRRSWRQTACVSRSLAPATAPRTSPRAAALRESPTRTSGAASAGCRPSRCRRRPRDAPLGVQTWCRPRCRTSAARPRHFGTPARHSSRATRPMSFTASSPASCTTSEI